MRSSNGGLAYGTSGNPRLTSYRRPTPPRLPKTRQGSIKPIGNRMGYERVYYYEGEHCIITGIGTNGFIVSAYPHRPRKEK